MRNEQTLKAPSDYLSGKSIILHKCRRKTAWAKPCDKSVHVTVRPRPGNPQQGILSVGGLAIACALGRRGISAFKREGDGATPLGTLRPLGIYFRSDRRLAGTGTARLPKAPIHADLGWCDAPGDPNYNRPVRLPYGSSHEDMLRGDSLYDICIVLDWNVVPRKRGCGSAIFLHMARPGMKPTEGCIAVPQRAMARLLPLLSPRTRILVGR